MRLLKRSFIFCMLSLGLTFGVEVNGHFSTGYMFFQKATVHKRAFVKNLLVNLNLEKKHTFSLFLNEVNFTNKRPHPDFPQAQVDISYIGRFAPTWLFSVGFHYFPYAKPKFTEYGKGYFVGIGKRLNKLNLKLRFSQLFFRKGLRNNQISPTVGYKFGKFQTFAGLDYHYLNKKRWGNFNFKIHQRVSLKAGVIFPLFGKVKTKVTAFGGKRLFSYQGRIIENHPREQLYGGKVQFLFPLYKRLKGSLTFAYKRFKELKTGGKKANVYAVLLGLGF